MACTQRSVNFSVVSMECRVINSAGCFIYPVRTFHRIMDITICKYNTLGVISVGETGNTNDQMYTKRLYLKVEKELKRLTTYRYKTLNEYFN